MHEFKLMCAYLSGKVTLNPDDPGASEKEKVDAVEPEAQVKTSYEYFTSLKKPTNP